MEVNAWIAGLLEALAQSPKNEGDVVVGLPDGHVVSLHWGAG